jgi:hypothetical protein
MLYTFSEITGQVIDITGIDNPEQCLWYRGEMDVFYPKVFTGWKVFVPNADEVQKLDAQLEDIEGAKPKAVLISAGSFYIVYYTNAKFYTVAENNSEYGTFEDCEKLLLDVYESEVHGWEAHSI